ncbi:MAG: NAD(P)/FAD-dependent oxidoreductase [Trueperaceae bacterium]
MTPLVIVGAGPVGLFLACLLAQRGREVMVLEGAAGIGAVPGKRPSALGKRLDAQVAPGRSSRSIGVHPPALEALALIDAARPLIDCGVAIRRARLFVDRRPVGSLSLAGCPGPFPFVLSLPQGVTEALLEERLEQLAPGSLLHAQVSRVCPGPRGMSVELADSGAIETAFVVGCDGRGSTTRNSLGLEFEGRAHDHHYLMADLPESTDLASDAAIFLGRRGVVESFPLPGDRRRWVARVAKRPSEPDLAQLIEAVSERSGFEPQAVPGVVASAFTAETRLASSLAGHHWSLAGDAAHVVSPIGGQGMNLGWLGALALLDAGAGAHDRWQPKRYEALQRRRARLVGRRAQRNMLLGGEKVPPLLREAFARTLLLPAFSRSAARYFTMRGL